MSSVSISAVIITFNEEENLARCLTSLQEVADEILVVDSFSTDKTREIAENLGARVWSHPFEGHIQQKNVAMHAAKFDMVLSLDADEALSEELRASISSFKKDPGARACTMNRRTNYCGQWISHGGWYPDRKLRLWHRDAGSWGGENPHDRVILHREEPTIQLRGDLLHYSFPTIASHVQTANRFSDIAAIEWVKKNKKVFILWHLIFNPGFTFFKKYVLKLGLLDGYYGFVIAVLSAYSNFLKYAKAYRLKRARIHAPAD